MAAVREIRKHDGDYISMVRAALEKRLICESVTY